MNKDIMLKGGVIALLFLFSTAHAALRYVHPDSALSSIQMALDTCASGDVVIVASGTYYENIVWPNRQGIRLQSEAGSGRTILDGDSAGSVIQITTGADSTTVISGFTIQNGKAYSGGGIYLYNSSPTISNNIITDNISDGDDSGGGGIYCYNSAPLITYNSITRNYADSAGAGIYCDNNSSATISHNIIFGDSTFVGGGIYCRESSPIITDNTITWNWGYWGGGGIGADANASPTITDNIIFENTSWEANGGGGGIGSGANCWSFITNNLIARNRASYGGGGIACYDASITNNTIVQNYSPYGGGIVCGDNSSPTITSNTITDNSALTGGGIIIDNGVTASITDNIIERNKANFGAGIAVGFASPTITSNFITSNLADSGGAGLLCLAFSSPTIDSCVIIANYGNGGDGIACEGFASPDIHYNDIIGNSGYGVLKSGYGTVDAEYNFWGDASGPGGVGPGSGDEVSNNVDYDPWLSTSVRDTVIPASPYIAGAKSTNDLILTWNPITTDTLGNPEVVNYYVVYRDTAPTFIPGSADSIGAVVHPETTYTDTGVLDSLDSYYYLVKSVDWTYNKSKKSNMGYKLNRFFNFNTDRSSRNWVSLPWHNEYSNVSDLVADLSPAGDPIQSVSNLRDDMVVETWLWDTDFMIWFGPNDFAIEPGRAYEMVPIKDTTLMLTGSNNPDGLISLNFNTDRSSRNWVSLAYNAAYNTVDDIAQEYSPAGDPLQSISNLRDDMVVETWLWDTDFMIWFGPNDFAIVPGRGYEFVPIKDTTWNPNEWSNEAFAQMLASRGVKRSDVEVYGGQSLEPDRAPKWIVKESTKRIDYLDAKVYTPVTERLYKKADYREPGISHIVRVHLNVKEFDNLVFTAYRRDMPYDVLTENMIGSCVAIRGDQAVLWFNVANFKRPWQDREEVILIIEATKQGRGYFTVVNVILDERVDVQDVKDKITLVPIPEPVIAKGSIGWHGVDNDNVVGYSLYKDDKRLNEKVLKRTSYAVAGNVNLKPVIRGGYETVYGSDQGSQSTSDIQTPIKYAFNVFPNPFVKKTLIDYALPRQTSVEIVIYDIIGRQVKTLVRGMHRPGYYSTAWHGTDARGREVASGIYFIRFAAGPTGEADAFEIEEKILMVK